MSYRYEFRYDFRTKKGVDMTALIPVEDFSFGPSKKETHDRTVKFYDRRFNHTPWGQFTGASYYVSTLLQSWDDRPVEVTRTFILHGGVSGWDIDAPNWIRFMTWLTLVSEYPSFNEQKEESENRA